MAIKKFDLSVNIREGETERFPIRAKTCPFILVTRDGNIEVAKDKTSKLSMLTLGKEGDVLLGVWPGQWSSDVFLIDLSKAKELLINDLY